MNAYRRHQMLQVSPEGRKRIFADALKESHEVPETLLEELFCGTFAKGPIPAIVRRPDEELRGMTAVGFVHPRLRDGRRFRAAAFVRDGEIESVITPYGLIGQEYEPRSSVMKFLSAVSKFQATRAGRLGVIGSAAMEIVTGAPYTNGDSDLDLLVRGCSCDEISEIFEAVRRLSVQFRTPADIEIELLNGYGIKTAELFSDSGTLLGKSVTDVKLLERGTVLALLGRN